ncbi:MAG: helix-turn-helix domain-containing protein [Methylococcales bacterium]|nr:helix-turn-helix domain-containing protein [Methylococcales bacterium]
MSEHSWLSTKEAAALLEVSQRTVQNWVDSGKIKANLTMVRILINLNINSG